jgi:5-methylcytosine-specific restriction enzyme A
MFSIEEYKFALNSIAPKLHGKKLEMLRFHYSAPNRAITAGQLASLIGYVNHSAVNMHYCNIGHLLSDALGKRPEQRKDGSYRWWKVLSTDISKDGHWVWVMRPALARALEELELVSGEEIAFPEEVSASQIFREGSVRQVTVNAYERNPEARSRCIAHYGATCFVCGFEFGKFYGEAVEGFIHVHHLRPLSEIGAQYEVNPIEDLRPVCPNCHAVIHSRRNKAYSIEEVKEMLLLAKFNGK